MVYEWFMIVAKKHVLRHEDTKPEGPEDMGDIDSTP